MLSIALSQLRLRYLSLQDNFVSHHIYRATCADQQWIECSSWTSTSYGEPGYGSFKVRDLIQVHDRYWAMRFFSEFVGNSAVLMPRVPPLIANRSLLERPQKQMHDLEI